MSLGDYTRRDLGRCFPRVSGDEPAYMVRARLVVGFSPREWG